MVITEKMFEDYKKNVGKGDCLVYGEADDGKFMNAMIGEPYDIMVALCCLITKFSENVSEHPLEIVVELGEMLKSYDEFKTQGGDR